MTPCRLCRQPRCVEVISFGSQPVCHRFVEGDQSEPQFPLALGQCVACGLVQLMQPMPLAEIIPRFDWITHNEPTDHLAAMAQRIAELPGISSHSRILGIFDHDEPLLVRLRAAGFQRTEQLDPVRDLGLPDARAGAALLQSRLNRKVAENIAGQRGLADVIISRRVLEHAYEPVEFLLALKSLVKPHGNIVLEVPDCELALKVADVAMVWEEHISYFTPHALQTFLELHGLRLRQLDSYPYPLENALVVTAEMSEPTDTLADRSASENQPLELSAFAAAATHLRNQVHRELAMRRARGERIAWLGAGHRSCTFINVFNLGQYLEFVVDDDPRKHRLKMPGSHLTILGSEALDHSQIDLCILCINPAAEARVIGKHQRFVDRGGLIASVAPGSLYSLVTPTPVTP